MAPIEAVQVVLVITGIAVIFTLSVPTVTGKLVVHPLASVMVTV